MAETSIFTQRYKTGCLDKLARKKEACAFSKALFAVLSLALAQLAFAQRAVARSERDARDWPSPCLVILHST